MNLNLELVDGTYLHNVILSTTRDDFSIGELKCKDDFLMYLESNNNPRMYFCGSYVQGSISHPRIIKNYEIFEDNESQCTLICNCGRIYNYIPKECDRCGHVFVDC